MAFDGDKKKGAESKFKKIIPFRSFNLGSPKHSKIYGKLIVAIRKRIPVEPCFCAQVEGRFSCLQTLSRKKKLFVVDAWNDEGIETHIAAFDSWE